VDSAALGIEDGRQASERFDGRFRPEVLVLLDAHRPFLSRDVDRRDLFQPASRGDGRRCAPLRLRGVRVLLGSEDRVLPREVFRRLPHQLPAKRAEESVAIHRVNDFPMAQALAEPHARQEVRGRRHAFGASDQHDLVLAGGDRERPESQRLERRGAGLVHREGRHHVRNSRPVRDLPGRVGAAPRLPRVAEDRFVDRGRRKSRAFERRLRGNHAQVGRRHRCKRAAELADGSPRGAQNENIPHTAMLLQRMGTLLPPLTTPVRGVRSLGVLCSRLEKLQRRSHSDRPRCESRRTPRERERREGSGARSRP
jgi:hypothetical protein